MLLVEWCYHVRSHFVERLFFFLLDFEVNGCIPHNAMRSGCLTLSCRTVDIFGASRARAAEESPFGSEEILQKMLEERMFFSHT